MVEVRPSAHGHEPAKATAGYVTAIVLAFASLVLPAMAASALPQTVVAGLAVLVVGLGTLALARDHFGLYLVYWLLLVLFQNLFAGAFDLQGYKEVPLAVTEAKTISIVLACLVNVTSIIALFRTHKALFLAVGAYFALFLVNVDELTTPAIAYARNFIFPVLILVLVFAKTRETPWLERLRLLQRLLYLAAFVLGLGALLEWLLGTENWRDLLNATQNGTLNSLATRTTVFGIEFQRFGGLLLEPINQGYLAASVVVVLVLVATTGLRLLRQPIFWLAMASAVIALVMSVAKNGALMFALVVVAVLIAQLARRAWVVITCTAAAGFVATMIYASTIQGPDYLVRAFTEPLAAVGGDSSTFHVAGLVTGLQSSVSTFPVGSGLGIGGNFGRIERGETGTRNYEGWLDTGAESAWGVVAYQIGLPAFIAFVAILVIISSRLGLYTSVAIAVWFAAATYSEAFTGPISSSILLLSAVLLSGPMPQLLGRDGIFNIQHKLGSK